MPTKVSIKGFKTVLSLDNIHSRHGVGMYSVTNADTSRVYVVNSDDILTFCDEDAI